MSHLYLKHFDLHRPPFQITPDTDFFFSGSQRGGILSGLLHVASHEEGIVVAVAEIGSGKTLLARLLISRLPEHVDTVYLANPCFNRDEIIIAISRDLGLPEVTSSTEENLSRLHRELVRRHALGRRVLLVIDEAHAMPSESIEEVRMLSNLETDRHKLVNIILFGQPELDVLLADRKLRQVKDRVTNRFELPPLTAEEAEAYVDHRLRIAGWRGGRLFTVPAMAHLVKSSEGRARRINLLADKSLLAAYAKAARQVEKEHVETALRELDAAPRRPSGRSRVRWELAAAGFALGAVSTLLTFWLMGRPGGDASGVARRSVPSMPVAEAAISPPRAQPIAPKKSGPATTTAQGVIGGPTSGAGMRKVLAADERSIEAPIFKRTEAVIEDAEKRGYTLQLAALPVKASLAKYLEEVKGYADVSALYAHPRTYGDKHVIAVYLGSYPDEPSARMALAALPEQLKSSQPVIRTWAGIRSEQNP